MEHDSLRRPRRMPRVPPFYPVPMRTRRDGWTVRRLRALPGAESFAAAWDAALGAPVRKVTAPALEFFAEGLLRVVMFRGRYREAWARPDGCALLRLVRRIERTSGRGDTMSPEW
jgi:hypothetical protein